jgi:hypothetical protein
LLALISGGMTMIWLSLVVVAVVVVVAFVISESESLES